MTFKMIHIPSLSVLVYLTWFTVPKLDYHLPGDPIYVVRVGGDVICSENGDNVGSEQSPRTGRGSGLYSNNTDNGLDLPSWSDATGSRYTDCL